MGNFMKALCKNVPTLLIANKKPIELKSDKIILRDEIRFQTQLIQDVMHKNDS